MIENDNNHNRHDDDDNLSPVQRAIRQFKDNFENEYSKQQGSPLKIILTIALVVFLILTLIFAVLFNNKGNKVAALICAGIFVGTIIGLIIFTTIKENKGFKKPKDAVLKSGLVMGCSISSQTTVLNKVKTVYKVFISVDGYDLVAYSRTELPEGITVNIWVNPDYTRCCIDKTQQ